MDRVNPSGNRSNSADPQWQARVDLAAAHRLAVMQGMSEAICNHFTLAVPGTDDRFFLIPYGLHWSEVSAKDFMTVSYEGEIISGSGIAEPTAFYIHAPFHRRRADARCVLHTHMPYATALSLMESPRLDLISQTSLMFAGLIAYDDEYQGLAMDRKEGERLAGVLGHDKAVLFLANHGVIVIGDSVARAYDRLYFLERACQLQVLARSMGRTKPIPEHVVRRTIEQQATLKPGNAPICDTHFAALKRLLDRREPGYAE
jgi:ribulose-5-phosphate 4-epimerase/fuculose-1-phosphate aldolase